jgi:hypothetical protein
MRQNFRLIYVGLSLLILAGCSDTSTAPSATAKRSFAPAAPAFDYAGGGSYGDSRSSFTVAATGGAMSVGGGLFNVNFAAGSICDPDLSSYGEGTWDSSCIPLARSVTITSTVRLTSSGLAVDFQPALRFVPGKVVTISTDIFAPIIRANREFFARNPSTLRPLAMYYSPFLGGERVPDYANDPSLVTHIDLQTGRIWRRIKHFSGYSQSSGEACNPSPDDPDCIEVEDDRSGGDGGN